MPRDTSVERTFEFQQTVYANIHQLILYPPSFSRVNTRFPRIDSRTKRSYEYVYIFRCLEGNFALCYPFIQILSYFTDLRYAYDKLIDFSR